MLVLTGLLLLACPVWPDDYTPAEQARFESTFVSIRQQLQNATNDTHTNLTELSWRFARAAFDWADAQKRDRDRARIAQLGIDACDRVLATNTTTGEVAYYRALNLGQVARTRTIGALRMVPQIEAAFILALKIDPTVDFAGPDRGLGLLYFEAPGWPTSIGNRAKARRHLLDAVTLAPDYPGNRLALAEALLDWDEPESARTQMEALDLAWPSLRRRFSTPGYEPDWRVWLQRRNAVARKLRMPDATLDPATNNPAPPTPPSPEPRLPGKRTQ